MIEPSLDADMMESIEKNYQKTLQLSNNIISSDIELMDNRNSENMSQTKQPSDYKIQNESYERKPTGGIQEIAEKPFTVIHIDKFTSKSGETMVIIDTEEKFDNIEYKNEKDEKVKGIVSRFFASPVETKRFFGDEGVINDVNTNKNKIRTSIEKVPFTPEEIKKRVSLKGKTHYVFKHVEAKQEKLGGT